MGDTEQTLLQAFMVYRSNFGYGILAAAINGLLHWKQGHTARDSFVDMLFCGAMGWSVFYLLEALHLPKDSAIIASCMIGYIGSTVIADFIKDKFSYIVGGKDGNKTP